jgi:hypothetical protein
MKENNLFIGTCSWKYEDWIGIIYTSVIKIFGKNIQNKIWFKIDQCFVSISI